MKRTGESVMRAQGELLKATWGAKDQAAVDAPYTLGANLRVDAAARLLRGGNRLLDVGCGSGALADAVTGRYREYYGVDLAEVAVEAAIRRGVKARVWDVNETPWPFEDRSFSAVAMLSVIQYVFDPIALASEIARVLEPGGQALIGFPNMRAFWRLARLIVPGRFPKVSKDPGFDGGTIRYFCYRDVVEIFWTAGLEAEGAVGVFARPRWLEGRGERWPLVSRPRAEFLCSEIIALMGSHP